MTTPDTASIRDDLLTAYATTGLWGESNPAYPLPAGIERGSDSHLAFLTLSYTLSGGREPITFWEAARTTRDHDPELFDPHFLAYIPPKQIVDRLAVHNLTRKPKSEATVFQRIGQALVMRAKGSVSDLLAQYGHDARQLLAMLQANKATFPVLSGPQTGPRWLYGLAIAGKRPLTGAARLPVPVSPAAKLALKSLEIATEHISAAAFDPLTALGRHGCHQRQRDQRQCPAATICPVARYCSYGQ